MKQAVETIIRKVCVEGDAGPDMIAATIQLPASLWEFLAGQWKDEGRIVSDDPGFPDMPLEHCVETYLQLLVVEWEYSFWEAGRPGHVVGSDDLDEDLPF